MIKICAVGGYGEFGKNSTVIICDKNAIILDVGSKIHRRAVSYAEKYPNFDEFLAKEKVSISGIFISHAHTDHVAGLMSLKNLKLDCKLYAGEYTIAVIKKLKLGKWNYEPIPGNIPIIVDNFIVHSYRVQHSIPDTYCFKIEVNKIQIVYLSDFKLDHMPVLHKQNVTDHVRALQNVDYLLIDTTRANITTRTQSESVVTTKLKDILAYLRTYNRNNIFIGCFSSNVARLQVIANLAKRLNYNLTFVGRSFNIYAKCAIELGMLPPVKIVSEDYVTFFSNVAYSNNIFVCTGAQGEPNSLLVKLTNGSLPYRWQKDDAIILAASPIPQPDIIADRMALCSTIMSKTSYFWDDVHTSGHAGMLDLMNTLKTINSLNVIPMHANFRNFGYFIDAAKQLGYKLNENVFLLGNNQSIEI